MPPEPLPFDRKEFLTDRKPSSLDPLGIVQPRWREPPTTPSQHNNRGSSSSCRWGSGGGPSDFRRPFSGLHGKRVGGGWHDTTVESGSKENSCITNTVSMPFGSQKDPKAGVNSWKTTASASPNGNSLLHNDQLQSVDQHAKNTGGGFSTTNSQRLEKENSLGSSLDWKPVKWIRSGSLSSRGSGFSHSSGCKIIGVDPLNTSSPLRSPSEDASQCVTPNTPDEANSRKKQRLGWGEGLAKYEKKKVDPDDIVDKEAGVRNGMVDGVSGSEPLLTSPYNMSDKSPSVNGYSECASPTTPYSFACSSSIGLEEKESTKTVTVDTSAASCHLSENHTEQLSSNLENLEHNLSFSIDELLQTDASRSPGSGFVKSTAMEKLELWKAELTRTLEITETEIDSLENELKSLVSDGGSCIPPASDSRLTESNHKTSEETCGPLPVEKTDSSPEGLNEVGDDSDGKSPGTTSEFVEPHAKCSEDVGNDDMLGFVASCGDGNEVPTGSSSTDSDGEDADNGREDNNKLYGLIVATNKAIANRASDELSRLLLPTTHLCTSISKATDESSSKLKFASRKRFLKFKERVITCKFRALQYSWKEELHSLSLKKIGAKSHKKFESSSRMGYADHQKCRSPGGSLTLVPTTETLDYVKKLLSDSRVKVHKKALKMPCLILDRSERMMTRFISENGLVENPVDIEKERSIVNPWTEKETEIFLEKYSLFGKDFKKIASFLESRTIGDCVEFYYKNHKSDCFQKAKKNSKFAKGKSCSTITTNTYLVTSGRRMNNEGVAGATSLEMLGAASAMVANVDSQQKSYHVGTSNDQRLLPSEVLSDFANEQETAAADVLAGICGSISSEALGSCITSSVDHGDVHHHHHGRRSLKLDGDDVDEDTCSDDSCDEDMDASYWTDEEKSRFIKAFRSHGKDFSKISRSMRTKTSDQCRVFFSKARKCLGLDVNDAEGGSEGNNESDDEDAFMVENDGSDISHNKSSLECSSKMDDDSVENNNNNNADVGVGERRSSDGCDSSASCPKVEGKVSRELTTCPVEDLNKATLDLDSSFDDDGDGNGGGLKSSGSEKAVADNGFLMMANFFPGDSSGGVVEEKEKDRKKSLSPCSQDDVSSRLSFRKSCDNINMLYERCSNLPKHSLLDSSQILRGYPVMGENKVTLDKSLLITSVDVEKEKAKSRSGGVKLFGQILTKRPQEESSSVVVNDKKAASASSLNVDHSNNVTIRSPHGYWDGKKVQLGMGIPDSERLLAKYPAAFSKTSAFLSFERNHQFRSSTCLRMASGFEACSSNGVEGFTVDKLLLPRKGGGMSDPVAAIRRHYANRGEEYKSKSGSADI